MISAKYAAFISVVVKPSAGLSVIGWIWLPSGPLGSGAFTISRTRLFCQVVRAHATTNAATLMTSRLRSSSRWSTTESRSSCEIGRIRRTPTRLLRLGLLLAGRRDASRLAGRLGLVRGAFRQLVLVLAGHRILELTHPAPERAAQVGQSLRAEHDQHDYEDDDDL